MNTQRYDIAAGRNVLNMLKRVSPPDYARLMGQLRAQAGMGVAGLGEPLEVAEETPGFWGRVFDIGGQALNTIANYKLQERYAKEQQKEYEAAAAAEFERQKFLAEQAKTQYMEYENQLALTEQAAALERAKEAAKSKLNWALIAAGGLAAVLAFSILSRRSRA